jgi:hypothetical protein
MKSVGVVLRILALALNGGEWLVSRPGRFISGETPVPIAQKCEWTLQPIRKLERQSNPHPPGIRPPILQSHTEPWELSRYSDYSKDWMAMESRVRFPAGARDFALLHNVHTGSGAHPASYRLDTGADSPGVKRLGCEAEDWHPSSTEVKNGEAISPLHHYVFMARCQGYLYLTLLTYTYVQYTYYIPPSELYRVWAIGTCMLLIEGTTVISKEGRAIQESQVVVHNASSHKHPLSHAWDH